MEIGDIGELNKLIKERKQVEEAIDQLITGKVKQSEDDPEEAYEWVPWTTIQKVIEDNGGLK